MRHHRAFTIKDILVVIACTTMIVILILTFTSDWLKAGRRRHRGEHSTRIRGMLTGLVMYAQGNNDHYPGIMADGVTIDPKVGLTTQGRVQILINQHYFTVEYARSPSEVQTGTTSYAMLQINSNTDSKTITKGGRNDEWNNTTNTNAVVISDRGVYTPGTPGFFGTPAGYRSIHTLASGKSGWQGEVAWNDNHVTFEKTSILPTKYGTHSFTAVNLFTSPGDAQYGDDAMMVWTGTDRPCPSNTQEQDRKQLSLRTRLQ